MNFNEIKKAYGNASLVKDDRVVFNIMGNKYRLVVRIVFDYKTIQVKWFGTHTEYDKNDVASRDFLLFNGHQPQRQETMIIYLDTRRKK